LTYRVEFRPEAAKQLQALPRGARRTVAMVVDALLRSRGQARPCSCGARTSSGSGSGT